MYNVQCTCMSFDVCILTCISTTLQLMNNEEITNIVKILGLHYSKKYADSTELRSLRYGRLLIMTDQDQDGSHIKGLVINFLHHNWPGLIRHSFVQEFITPIVKVQSCILKQDMALPCMCRCNHKLHCTCICTASCVCSK